MNRPKAIEQGKAHESRGSGVGLRRFVLPWFCRHEWEFVENIYADEIILAGWNRSWWKCSKCNKRKLKKRLHQINDVAQ